MPSIESAVIRVVAEVSGRLAPQLTDEVEIRRASASTAATEALLRDFRRADTEALEAYLDSPDFATVVAQHRVGSVGGKVVKDQLYQGLRLAGLSDDLLTRTAEVVHDVMVAAGQEAAPQFGGASAKIDRSDLYTAAASNSAMLKRLKSATRIHAFAARMRDQVVALHNRIRLPHVGVSRSVRYDQLYVEPTLASPFVIKLGAPGERVLVQGDPGAGKSTLAAKFAHDIATEDSGRVPFLLVLREFTTSFDEGGRDLLHYLEKLCQAPYNVKPPRDGVEYLLRTGRAVVILDGLDELVQTELRRRVVALVEGFAHLYPLVPILVTARKIGYEDAPLSTDLFIPSHIAEFSNNQVTKYVTRWFELDEATSPAESAHLTRSFLWDSVQIPELRSNPLLLTLLCAMYSSDRYLPQNLAQVYERCALMLFEQWDSKRGIALSLRFHGRLRGAVQRLAWQMFNAAKSGNPLPRTRIVNILARYLDTKLDDHDESVAMAEEFLAFCTGRAWILTDVGATESEPQFGFTHRTFLEYFAAEYLVRTHRTAAELWSALRPNIDQWDVVAQIVLQLYDRNVEGGVDELLNEALAQGGLGFAARSLHHVHPSHRTVRAIATAAVDESVLVPLDLRLENQGDSIDADVSLVACMHGASAANLSIIEQTVPSRLSELIERGEPGAALVLECMVDPEVFYDDRWPEIQRDLCFRYRTRLIELQTTVSWAGRLSLAEPKILHDLIRRFGAHVLYTRCWFHDRSRNSIADVLLESHEQLPPSAATDAIAITMTSLPTPWIDDYLQVRHISIYARSTPGNDSLRMLLALPLLEYDDHDRAVFEPWPDHDSVPAPVGEFLERWKRGEVSVTLSGQ
ncbi:NACHT domain-containing protein [Lentzea terrae]|uniref:NACHT domain-containing protein n=1 Tax=Lentzea terrae TaxID=2200761 RepID=UPI000DD38DC4|nr:NACHT domain-containing protein [Lentzea terrae]